MVYGQDERVRDENWPISDTKFYSQWRKRVETKVIHDPHFDGVVMRPGWVFGVNEASSGHFESSIFGKGFLKGRNKERRFSWIHIDDLCEAYVAVVNRIGSVKGEVFNIVNGYDNWRQIDLVKRGCELAGIEFQWIESDDVELTDNTSVLQSSKALRLLDWRPKIFGLLDNLEFYYECYKAFLEKNDCEVK